MNLQIKIIKKHCFQLINSSRCKKLPYHNLQHTLEVFENVQTIGVFEEISDKDLEVLKIAALFHDTGFAKTYIGHEEVSVINARKFLKEKEYPDEFIENVIDCIRVTKIPQQPISKIENIMCDSDLFHLSKKDYMLKSGLLLNELNLYLNLNITDEQWLVKNLNFLKKHQYFSNYGKAILRGKKISISQNWKV